MAPSVDSGGRTRCSGLGPGCDRRMWYTLVCLVLCLPCMSTSPSDTLTIHPEGDILVTYGEDLEMFCTAGDNYTSKDLMFTLGGRPLLEQTEEVNSTTIRLFMKHPKESKRQTFFCKNKRSQKNSLKAVVVASPPKNVVGFKCVSKNFDVLNCSWSCPDKIVYTNYTIYPYVNGNPSTPCTASAVDNTYTKYCVWNTNSTPRYRQLEPVFHFHLDAFNKFGRNQENFTVDHFSVVKPDPPLHLHNVSVGPHSVLLQWAVPINIFDFLKTGVEHRIEYQIAKIDNTSYFRRVNTASLPTRNKTYRFNLTELPYAHMQYGVRVYIKPTKAKEEFWSDFSTLVFYTSSERPSRPPKMAAGAFTQNKFEGYRVIHLYWKQLEEYEEAGANFTYLVIVKQNSKTQTLFPEKSKGLGFLELERATLNAIEVSIWSFNEKGKSANSSSLYIPPESETHYLHLARFTKLAYENGTYELSWSGSENIDNYTLFWCQQNTTELCNGRLDFVSLDAKQNKHVIDLPRDYRYEFAIAANKGPRTSGMVWARCDISKDQISMYRFPLVFTDHGAPGKTSVELRWSLDCILKEGIIIGYNISYCPVVQTSSLCDKTGRNHSKYINDPKQWNTTIDNLEPYRTYQFTMSLNTSYGLKTIENTTVRITTLEDTPSIPRNVWISNVKNDSLTIQWDRPEHLNGHVSKIKYVIYNNNKKLCDILYEDHLSDDITIMKTLDQLDGFTNYSLSVQACNVGIDACSNLTTPVSLRTCIGAPSKLRIPTFKYQPDLLTWEQPDVPGGTVDQYQVKIIKDGKELALVNTTDMFFPLTQCEGTVKLETYQVRAVNFDSDPNHGSLTDFGNVTLPTRDEEDMDTVLMYPGEWSDESIVRCNSTNNLFLFFIIMGVLAIIGAGCGLLKVYKKIGKMRDIKPEFPKGLFIAPEKDSKYPFTGLYPQDKDEKPSSDESLLLPSKAVSTPDMKQKENDNCGSSDHTNSTALSDASQCPIDRQNSTSDDDSNSSLHLEVEPIKQDNKAATEETSSIVEPGSSRENSPYFSDNVFKKNKVTGYVQPMVNPGTGYVQSAVPSPFKSPPATAGADTQPASTSYVMAGLHPPIFTGAAPSASVPPPSSSGYVRPEDVQPRQEMNFPKLGPSPTKIFGVESLPSMPALPAPTKNGGDSSYIQLQSLDSLPSHKTPRNPVPLKPPAPAPASNGYVSPGDAVLNKHLHNLMSGPLAEESAILDPAMSPDAYCRFSWSTDPANDNLHSLLGNSPTINSFKN